MGTYTYTAPDGQVIEFPGPPGLPPAEIERRARMRAGLPQQSSYLGGAGQQALQGATMGFGEEAQAAIASVVAKGMDAWGQLRGLPSATKGKSIGDLYDEALAELRGEQADFVRRNPGTALAANVAGGLATGGVAAKGLQLARAPVTGLKGVAASGAGLGAISGAGSAGEGERLSGAVSGALGGALFGTTASGVGLLARKAWTRVAPGVANRLQALAEASGLTPAQIATRLRALGPKATLADVEEVFRRAADVAAGRLGPTARKVRDLIRRDESQFGRLMAPIRRTLGGVDQAVESVRQFKDQMMQQASPLYERAYAAGVENTDELLRLLDTPEGRKAWRSARMVGLSDPDVDLALFGGQGTPSLRGWQAIIERLWDRGDQLARHGNNKFAGVVLKLRRKIINELEGQNTDYARARELWAGAKEADDMLDAGRKFLSMTATEVRDTLADASNADKAFFRIGAGQAIEERLARTGDTSDLTRVFRNQAFRDKAMVAFDSKEVAVDFINTVRAEAMKKTTSNVVGVGSQTQPRQAAERQLTGSPIVTTKEGLRTKAANLISGPREKTVQEIGELLLSMDPADQQHALALMAGAQRPVGAQLGAVGAGLANLGGGALSPTPLVLEAARNRGVLSR